jgi:hypothetical protein
MSARCANCQANLTGAYCADCGQKAHTDDRSLGALLHGVLGTLISYDNKFWTTLVPLLLRPGTLTRDHVEGRRQRHFDPVRMFLLVSVLVFIAPDTMNVPVYELSDDWAAPAAEGSSLSARAKIGLERLREFDPEDTEALTSFNVTVAKRYLTMYMVAGVIGLALFLKLIHRKRFFTDHLVFALHIAIFMYVWNWAVRLPPWSDEVIGWLMLIGQTAYMMAAYWRIYGWAGWKGRAASIVGGIAVNLALLIPYSLVAQACAIYTLMPPAA